MYESVAAYFAVLSQQLLLLRSLYDGMFGSSYLIHLCTYFI